MYSAGIVLSWLWREGVWHMALVVHYPGYGEGGLQCKALVVHYLGYWGTVAV